MKVVKFGGTSLANAAQIKKVRDIVIRDPERRIVVVSAPGKRRKDDAKVTDLLIALAEKYYRGKSYTQELAAVIERYAEIARDLSLGDAIITEIENDLNERLSSIHPKKSGFFNFIAQLQMKNDDEYRFFDLMKAAGEDNNAKLIAEYFTQSGHAAKYVNPKEAGLLLSDEYANAQALPESYAALKKLKAYKEIVVFPGFFGYSKKGDTVTFPRGGSDITGAILAKAVKADVYENFTDVDSVFVASPRIVERPQPVDEITYREMRELTYGGFAVLHSETLFPVYEEGIPVNIKNTNNPEAPGTFIRPERKSAERPIVGIASESGFGCIYLSKYLMNREVGFGRKLLSILEDVGVPYEHTPSGIDNISIIVHTRHLHHHGTIKKIVRRIQKELHVDSIRFGHRMSLIMLVGEGMRHHVGIAARATNALAGAGVNLEMINQGSSEVSMMFAVKTKDEEHAVRALYTAFFPQAE